MKQMKFLAAFILLTTALSITACQKEVSPAQQGTISKEQLAGTYQVTGLILRSNTGIDENVYTTIDDCQKQGRQVLQADYSYRLVDACNPADSQTGTWALLNTSTITINGLSGHIMSFDGQKLVLSFENFLGMPGTMIETLAKQ